MAAAIVVVPRVLSHAGLDEKEVQIGLAAFAAVGVLSSLAARPAARGAAARATRPKKKPSATRKARAKREVLSPREARRKVGIAFNKARAHAYPRNEVPIAKPGGGKPYVLDSYDPIKGEIVFRRHTQFSEIQSTTAKSYFREFVKKYPPGSVIADVPSAKGLAGKKLEGRMIFEVPPQWKAVPMSVRDEATRLKILIRDTNGRIYNPH